MYNEFGESILNDIAILLGDPYYEKFTREQITLCIDMAKREVEDYCNITLDAYYFDRDREQSLRNTVIEMVIIKLSRLGTEGLASQSAGGISEVYLDGYPKHIMSVLNRKRRLKVM